MKKIFIVLLALTALVSPYAQAKTCSGSSCNYIDVNGDFQSSPASSHWSPDTGVLFIGEGLCYYTTVADIPPGKGIDRETFYVDGNFSSFQVQFRAFLPVDINSVYDELRVIVTNTDTGVSEVLTMNSYNSSQSCSKRTFSLSRNYSHAHVKVRFEIGGLAQYGWQIDDVTFFAFY